MGVVHMLRCRVCGALNADHAYKCEKCDAKIGSQLITDKEVENDYVESNTFGMIVALFSSALGLGIFVLHLIAGSFELVGLLYLLLGIALITVISKSQENGERIKSLEIENEVLRKKINEIKEALSKKQDI